MTGKFREVGLVQACFEFAFQGRGVWQPRGRLTCKMGKRVCGSSWNTNDESQALGWIKGNEFK